MSGTRPTIDLPAALRDEVRLLGRLLGEVIAEQAGQETYERVESLRRMAVAHRRDGAPREDIGAVIDGLTPHQAEEVTRAFTLFFQLANIAEQREQVRSLRQRDDGTAPLPDSIEAAVAALRDADPGLEATLEGLRIHPVWTAHPTEARRRAVVDGLRRVNAELGRLDDTPLGGTETDDVHRRLREEIEILWTTAQLRASRPTPVDEVRKLMAVFDATVFLTLPRVYRAMDRAVHGADAGRVAPGLPTFITFGSWVGGDRDGNPRITSTVTAETAALMADRAMRGLENATRRIARTLTAQEDLTPPSTALVARLEALEEAYPTCARAQLMRARREPHRRMLTMAAERLVATRTGTGADPDMAYDGPESYIADLKLIQDSLVEGNSARLAYGEVQHLLWQARTFGFNLASLEVRQHTDMHAEALRRLGIDPDDLDALRAVVADPPAWPDGLTWPEPPDPVAVASAPHRDLSETGDVEGADPAGDVLPTMRTVAAIQRRFGRRACHRWVISFTTGLVDYLRVRALAAIAGLDVDIIGLFETREDLDNAPDVLEQWLAELGGEVTEVEVMLGYSDSAKDAGFLAANLALHRAQHKLVAWARRAGITLTMFHGRGGALGRGGGPTNRAVLAQPRGAVTGGFKVTEQGEVINQRYGKRHLAARHLEQITNATMLARAEDLAAGTDADDALPAVTDLMGAASEAKWRELVEGEGFAPFFRTVTPIDEIGALQMGSRPSKRKTGDGLSSLRAIPWTFAWAQSRINAPGWYGLGTGLQAAVDEVGMDRLKELFATWPFFANLMENAELSLVKADAVAAREVLDGGGRPDLTAMILEELERTTALVLEITGQDHLLQRRDVLAHATALRNPYLDVLTAVQNAWISRARAADATRTDTDVLMLSMNGIAAALQNTG